MILEFLRIAALMWLIIIIIIDIKIPVILHTPVNQLIIAFLIITIILAIDEIFGFLLGLAFLVIYFKYYQNLIKNNGSLNQLNEPLLNNNEGFSEAKPEANQKTDKIQNHYIKYSNGCIEMPYISNELLENAQNNIYDIKNYNNEIRIDNNTYGIQGLNSDKIHYPAFDATDNNFTPYVNIK